MKIPTIEVECLRNGEFKGDEAEVTAAGVEYGELCVVVKATDWEAIQKRLNEQPKAATPKAEEAQPFDWFCDWCDKGMKENETGVSDANGHMHCSQECVDDHNASR